MSEAKADWNSVEHWKNVVAALMATSNGKINIAAAAEKLGMTYNALEGGLRKVKPQVAAMNDNDSPTKTKKKTATTPAASPASLNVVKTGRVTKTRAPKKSTASRVKAGPDVDDQNVVESVEQADDAEDEI